MNIEHHNEQMEAVRRDFSVAWDALERRAASLGCRDRREMNLIQDIAWQSFMAGIKAGKKKSN